MNWANRSMAVCGIIGLVALPPAMASAEWFGDLYGGAALSGRTTAHYSQMQPLP